MLQYPHFRRRNTAGCAALASGPFSGGSREATFDNYQGGVRQASSMQMMHGLVLLAAVIFDVYSNSKRA
jgi:uncharacterized membrane protein YgdD (TMEM256/DUF423 family)